MGGRELLRDLSLKASSPPTITGSVSFSGYPSIKEQDDRIAISKFTEIIGATPELRLTESDQTDPAGRYRLQVTGDVLNVDRALTAAWATVTNLIAIDEADGALQVTLSGSLPELRFAETDQADPAGRWRILATSTELRLNMSLSADWATSEDFVTAGTGILNIAAPTEGFTRISISGDQISFWTKTSAASSVQRMAINGGADITTITMTSLLNAFVNTTVPTTGTLSSGYLRFVVDAGDQLVGYWNDAGTIRTFVLGTFL